MGTVIIGSGPAAVAAAHALCEAGRRVTILDAGDRIEEERMDVFDELARSEPEQWPTELTLRARGAFPVGAKHVPLKPAYGSLFLYALEDPDLPLACENAEALASLAYGGLSNAWGASILPFRQCDIEDWPISLDELRPHYEAVLRFVPAAAELDELAKTLPLYTDLPGALRRGPQTEVLLRHMRRHAATLRASGFTFGASRLAVAAAAGDPRHCRGCGLCLYGCPYGSIYNASHTLEVLRRSHSVDYRGDIYVDRLTEGDTSVAIDFHRRGHPAERGLLHASRVLVACGSLSSTRLMLDSLGASQRGRRLQDSLYFMVPMLTVRAAAVSTATQGNTLAQVFVEYENADVTAHAVHLQIYGYNDLMLSALAKQLRMGTARLERMLRPVLGRSVLVQGFLHSRDSPGIAIESDKGGVRVVGESGATYAVRVRKIVRRLAAAGRVLGMAPIPGLLMVGRPGKSNHLGGSLPMRRQPRDFETDTLGRPPSWDRVHVIDASIFPSVPATTVTLSVMANAHRIATAIARSGD